MMRWNELSKQLSDATKSVVGSAQSKFQSSLAGNVVGEVAFSSPKEEEIILDEPLEEITLDPTTASSTTDSQFDIISGTLETVPRAQLEIAVLKSLQNIKVLKKKIKQEEIKATAAIENSHQSSKRLVQMQDELDRKEMTLIRTVASLRDELSSRDTEVENLKSQLKLSDSKTQDIAVLTSNMETTSRSYTDLIEKYNSLESKYHALMNTQSIVEGNPVDDLSVLQNNELIELKKMYHESESHFNSEINKYKFEISRLTADAGGSKLAPCLSKVESPRISFIEDNDSRGVAPPPPPPPPPSELTSEYFSILCEILGLIRHRVYEAQSNSDSNLFDFTYAFEALKSRVLLPTQYHTMLVELLSSLIEDIANTLKRLHSCEEELKRVTKEKTTLNDTVRTAISREAKLKGLLAAANDSLLSTQSQLDGYSETKSNVETQLIELENRYKILSEKYYKETTPPINANVILKVAVDDVIWVCTKNDKTSWWPEKSLDANTSSIPTLQQSLCNEQMALQENFRIATLNVKRLELQNSRLKESEESLQNKVQSLYVSSSRPRTAPAPTSSCSSCATASQEKLETENRYERMLQDAKQAFDNIQTTLSDVILEKDKQMDYLNSSLLESSSLVDLLKSRNADLEVELRKLSLNVQQQQQQQQQLIRNKTIKLIRCDLPAIDSRRFNSDEDSEAPSAAASSSEDALFHKRSSSSSSSVVVEEKGFLSRHVKDLQGELKLEQEKRIVLEELSGFLKMELLKLEKLLAIKWDSTGSMTGGTPIEFVRNTIIKLMETDTTKTDEHESLFFVLADIFKFDENERRRLLIKNNNNNRGSRWF